ncbi:unnamed protein product [Rotaria magnacalcarata]|uniref:Beta-lactamase-related domain-containing protein n=1 Tax=Rotaria magnacalcarata TaxID=392030 RepID=A0A816MLN3_9BILA|nr:unnamed protein product [Rotaria magnacalcarata]
MVGWLSIRLVVFLMICATVSSTNCPNREWIKKSLKKAHIPGAVVMVINATDTLYAEAFGHQSLTPKRHMNIDRSIFSLASVSKTFVGTAVMQLVEQSLVDLDIDVNQYLSEPQKRIFHPDFPSNSITLRKLLSHSASIATSRQVTNSYYHPGDTAFAESLTDACYRIINPNTSNWLPQPPGTVIYYSNEGNSLAALVVEKVSNMSYIDYVEAKILKPLGIDINKTGVRLADFSNIEDLVKHYAYAYNESSVEVWHEKLPKFNITKISDFPTWLQIPFYGFSIYPAGLLRMSARSLATYLQMFLNNGSSILRPQSIVEMRRPVGDGLILYYSPNSADQLANVDAGLGWYWLTKNNGRRYVGHEGSMPGVTHSMFVNEKNNLGVIVLSTGDISSETQQSKETYETVTNIYMSLFECFDTDIM